MLFEYWSRCRLRVLIDAQPRCLFEHIIHLVHCSIFKQGLKTYISTCTCTIIKQHLPVLLYKPILPHTLSYLIQQQWHLHNSQHVYMDKIEHITECLLNWRTEIFWKLRHGIGWVGATCMNVRFELIQVRTLVTSCDWTYVRWDLDQVTYVLARDFVL